jgi:hypothetical protein
MTGWSSEMFPAPVPVLESSRDASISVGMTTEDEERKKQATYLRIGK